MRAHDVEAPAHVPRPAAPGAVAPRRPPGRVLLVAAVVVLLLAAAGTWLALAWPHDARRAGPARPATPARALACPENWSGQFAGVGGGDDVPAAATVSGAGDRLVPEATPAAVIVCGYAHAARTITGSAALQGDLGPVRDALTELPRGEPGPCVPMQTPSQRDQFLIGLTYEDGTVWVSAPGNHCDGAGNGSFHTPVNLRAVAASWLAARRWVDPADPYANDPSTAHCHPVDGRLGQETVMVPGTPTSLTICVEAGVVALPHTVPSNRIPDVVAVVDALAAAPLGDGTIVCGGEPAYALYFGYASGPAVLVEVSPIGDCHPNTSNGALQGEASPALVALVHQLTQG